MKLWWQAMQLTVLCISCGKNACSTDGVAADLRKSEPPIGVGSANSAAMVRAETITPDSSRGRRTRVGRPRPA